MLHVGQRRSLRKRSETELLDLVIIDGAASKKKKRGICSALLS